jgi:hypothetical protein
MPGTVVCRRRQTTDVSRLLRDPRVHSQPIPRPLARDLEQGAAAPRGAPWGMGCRVWAAARCLERGSGQALYTEGIALFYTWKECNSVGNRGGTQEPQCPSRREGALARTGLAQGQGVRGSGSHCCKRPGLGSTVPRALKLTRSRAPFDEGSRDSPREASPSHETVLRDAHLRSEVEFFAHPSRGGATFPARSLRSPPLYSIA